VIDVLPDRHAKKTREMRHLFHRKLVAASILNDRFPTDVDGNPTAGKWQQIRSEFGPTERDWVENDAVAGSSFTGNTIDVAAIGNQLCELVEFW
jgi:hypothetical protein